MIMALGTKVQDFDFDEFFFLEFYGTFGEILLNCFKIMENLWKLSKYWKRCNFIMKLQRMLE